MLNQDVVYEALKSNSEGKTIHADGSVWKEVYLPNIQYLGSKHQVAGYLSALKQKGLYSPLDSMFGEVRVV